MKKILRAVVAIVVVLGAFFVMSIFSSPVFADDHMIIQADSIEGVVSEIARIFVHAMGAACVLGVAIAGVQYLTAGSNESQMAAAKKRIVAMSIGILAWAAAEGFMAWLLPNYEGGIINDSGAGAIFIEKNK